MISAIVYRDPFAALDFLERAFGFERFMVITDDAGMLQYSEMRFGDAVIMIGREWDETTASPASLNGRGTQSVHVHLKSSLMEHCQRARAAGAAITRDPGGEFYGDLVYCARDLEGHRWTFAQTVEFVSREEAEKRCGLKIDGWI